MSDLKWLGFSDDEAMDSDDRGDFVATAIACAVIVAYLLGWIA